MSTFQVRIFIAGMIYLVIGLFSAQAFGADKFVAEKLALYTISGEKILAINETDFGGLLEVVTEKNLYYTDKGAHILLVGATMLDVKTGANLTALRNEQLGAVSFDALPLRDAIKTVKGRGRRAVAIFQDANCGYCKKLEKELAAMDDITIYTFLVGMLSPDSLSKGIAIWCAADRDKAWHDAMLGSAPVAPASCADDPLARNTALSKKLRIDGTPTLLLQSGKRLSGFATVARLDAALAAARP